MMERETGERKFPLWLIGDSNPLQWQSYLQTPFDPRHPIRHNIWTPILDVIQDKVFRAERNRVDTSMIYIRNAVDNPAKKPNKTRKEWKQFETENEVKELQCLIQTNKPVLVLCFGAFAYEFTRRAVLEPDEHNFGYWGAL